MSNTTDTGLTSKTDMARFWTGFVLLAAWAFGLLGYAVYLLATGRPGLTLAVVALVLASGTIVPRFLAWLVMFGTPRTVRA